MYAFGKCEWGPDASSEMCRMALPRLGNVQRALKGSLLFKRSFYSTELRFKRIQNVRRSQGFYLQSEITAAIVKLDETRLGKVFLKTGHVPLKACAIVLIMSTLYCMQSDECTALLFCDFGSQGARGFYNDMSNVASWAQGQDSHVSDDELNDRLLEEQPENADKSSVLRMPLSHLSGHLGQFYSCVRVCVCLWICGCCIVVSVIA